MYDKCSDCEYGDAENLRLENQELKKQLEISESNEETYYLELRQIGECLGLNKECTVEDIYQKINELKKQLEEMDSKLFFTKNELEMRQKSIDNKLRQQKEFIEWLENYIEWLENYIDALIQQKETVAELDITEVHILMTLEEALSKYKEIIGSDNK